MLTNRRTSHPRVQETYVPKPTSSLPKDKKPSNFANPDATDASSICNFIPTEASHPSEPPVSPSEPPQLSLSLDAPQPTPVTVEPVSSSEDDLIAEEGQEQDASEENCCTSFQDLHASLDLIAQECPSSGTNSPTPTTEHVDQTSSEESTDRQDSLSLATHPETPTSENTTDPTNDSEKTPVPTVKPYSLKTQITTHKVNFPHPTRFSKNYEFPSSSRLHEGGGIGHMRPSKHGFSMNKYASGTPVVPRPSMQRRTLSFPTPQVTSVIMNQNVDPTVIKRANGDILVTDPLPLYFSWSFLYTAPKDTERADAQRDWEMDIKTVVDSISTVQQFCRMWNFSSDLREPSRLPHGSNMFFFRSGVKPAWEDPQNIGGGRISLIAETRDINAADVWRDILLDLVGATLPHPEAICGVAVMNHKDQDRFDIWLTRAAFNRKILTTVGEEISSKLSRNFPRLRLWNKAHPRQ